MIDYKSVCENHPDSLDFIGFIIEVEKEFGVHITDEEREDIKTPEDLINLVFEKTR